MWYPHSVTVLLHPDVGSHFASELFVYRSGISVLGKLVWQGESNDELNFPMLCCDVDTNTDVETAADPVVRWENGASIASSQGQVMPDQGRD